MLHRADPEGRIIISQPAHAWVSGQLARHWGRAPFERPTEEVCLAAEQHDIGFLDWEQNPSLNPATGLPYTFLELPTPVHLEIWRRGIQQMLRFGRYPALLVSMHYTGLAKRNEAKGGPADQLLRRQFLEQQQQLQSDWVKSLKNDACYAARLNGAVLRREQELVSLWDWMSLLLCHPFRQEARLSHVPAGNATAEICMTPLDPQGWRVRLLPWPFVPQQLRLVCEGRRLPQSYSEETTLQAALRAAPPVMLQFELVPE